MSKPPSGIHDRMIEVAKIPTMAAPVHLMVHGDYESTLVGAYRLDLDGIGRLQVALDREVERIRAYQERKAAEADAGGAGTPEWEARTRELRAAGWTHEADARDNHRDREAARRAAAE